MAWALVVLLCICLIILCFKIYNLKRSAREIDTAVKEKLSGDTNTLIDISSRDKDMTKLAGGLNKELDALRREHLKYHYGDTELKNAITNVSHDIRTPLTAVKGYTDLALKSDDISEIKKYLEIIDERVDPMKGLSEELFNYAIIMADSETEATENVLVNQVLEESIAGAYPSLAQAGITPNIKITDKHIYRDLNRADLARVFSNLLNNAVKYSDGDLEITMTDECEIVFSNTAQKLSTVEVGQLSDRFFTVESARNSTGLGLSIVKTLVGRMGGCVCADYKDLRLIIKVSL